MSNLEHIKSKPADMHTLNSTYKAGNTTYIVNSHFAGKEKIDDLVFEILCKKHQCIVPKPLHGHRQRKQSAL